MIDLKQEIQRWAGKKHGAQAAFQKKVGKSKTAVSQWLTGESTPGEDTMAKMAEILGLPLEPIKDYFSSEKFANKHSPPMNEFNDSGVKLLQQALKTGERKRRAGYGRAVRGPFRVSVPTGEDTLEQLKEGTYFTLEAFGNDLEEFGIENGDTIHIRRQDYALEGDPVLVRVSDIEVEIRYYIKTKGLEVLGLIEYVERKVKARFKAK